MKTLSPRYITPRCILSGSSARDAVAQGHALSLGGGLAFAMVELTHTDGPGLRHTVCRAHETPVSSAGWLAAFEYAPFQFLGLPLATPLIMGVVNVTPDSFSDGGRFLGTDAAIAHARQLREDGADIIDVGGESTRPGAAPVAPDEEAARVVPVVRALAAEGVCVSIDTRHAVVMKAAIAAGARIVNDVTALTGDADAIGVVARSEAGIVLMHMQGEPRTMQENPTYIWAPGEVFEYFQARLGACQAAGIPYDRIAIDPGIGFGKEDVHNTQILNHLTLYRALGCPIVVGASRKSFIGRMSRGEAPQDRLGGSIAAAVAAVGRGAQIVRVHDVAATRQALAIAGRIDAGQ